MCIFLFCGLVIYFAVINNTFARATLNTASMFFLFVSISRFFVLHFIHSYSFINQCWNCIFKVFSLLNAKVAIIETSQLICFENQ